MVDQIERILSLVSVYNVGLDTYSLAREIAEFERSLALVRQYCIDMSVTCKVTTGMVE